MVWLFSSVLMITLEGHLRGEASMEWVKRLEILVKKGVRILNPRIKYPRSSEDSEDLGSLILGFRILGS